MLKLEQVKKDFGSTKVLKGINAQLASGELLTIMGASGTGKSTLLHLIAGLDTPTQGSISWNGQTLQKKSARQMEQWRNKGVGLVFQFHNLLPELTALENVQLPLWIGNEMSRKAAQEKAAYWLDYLGLSNRMNHYPNQLSGGQQQRVAIARALIAEPPLLLADEPTGNLDAENAQSVHELLVKLNKDLGKTIIVVTHNPALAALGSVQWTMENGVITP